jgi:hypothetical protein
MARLNSIFREHWFEILLASVVMAIYIYAALSEAHNFPVKWYTRDDAYYYFKVAQNIGEGRGVTFDGINSTNGFHPLWMLICIPIFALARFDLILPLRVLTLVLGAISVATAILLYRLLSRVLSREVGMLAAIYWALDLWVFKTATQLGLETGLTTLTMVFLLYELEAFERTPAEKIDSKQIAALALAAALMLFSRLDTIYLLMFVGVWIILRKTSFRYFLLADLLIAACGIYISLLLRVGVPEIFTYSTAALTTIGLSFILKATTFFFFGLYQPVGTIRFKKLLSRALIANAIASAILFVIVVGSASIFKSGFPRSVIAIDLAISLAAVIIVRLAACVFHTTAETQPAYQPIQFLRGNWKRWLGDTAVYYGITLGLLAVYLLYNLLTIGTPMPVSGEIKRWWGSLEGNAYGGAVKSETAFFGLDPESTFQPWEIVTQHFTALEQDLSGDEKTRYWIVLGAIVALSALILLSDRKHAAHAVFKLGLIPLLIGGQFQILFYAGQGYASTKNWYWISPILFVVLLGGVLVDILLKKIRGYGNVRVASFAVVIGLGIGLAVIFGQYVASHMTYTPVTGPYMDVLTLLEDNTEPGALIGMTGGGNVGYYLSDRTIVNMDGLINSYAYFRALKDGRGGEYLHSIGLAYVFANPSIVTETLPYSPQFKGFLLEPVAGVPPYGKKVLMKFILLTTP